MSEIKQVTVAEAATAPADEALQQALRSVIDPEAGMNIVDLGLIYRLEANASGVEVDITMTSPACPLGEMIIDDVKAALQKVVASATPITVTLVWSPPWEPSMMSGQAKAHFGW